MRVIQLEVAQCSFKPRRAGSKVWGSPEAQLKGALESLEGYCCGSLSGWEVSQAVSIQSK